MNDSRLEAEVYSAVKRLAKIYGWSKPIGLEDGIRFRVEAEWSDFRLDVRRCDESKTYAVACRFAVAPPLHRAAEIARLVYRLNLSLYPGRFVHDSAVDTGICSEDVSFEAAERSCGEAVARAALGLVTSCNQAFPAFHIVAWTAARAEYAINRTLYGSAGCA